MSRSPTGLLRLLLLSYILPLGSFAIFCGTPGCFVYPKNACPTNTLVNTTTAPLSCGSTCSACSTSLCCGARDATCALSAGATGCCTPHQSGCPTSAARYLTRRSLSGIYTPSCLDPVCPNNYITQSLSDSFTSTTASFCIPSGCLTVSGTDCTRCLTCQPGFQFVNDGSCQPPPTFQISAYILSTMTTGTILGTLQLQTDPDSNFAYASFFFSGVGVGAQSFTGAAVTITSTSCTLNNSVVTAGVPNVLFVGTTIFRCLTTDSNNITGTWTSDVIVNDLQPPTVRCNSIFVSPTNLTTTRVNLTAAFIATDNIGIRSRNCSGTFSYPSNTQRFINCTATDLAGNMAWCSLFISTRDTTPPVLNCSNIKINTTLGAFTGIVPNITFTATDMYNITNTSCDPPPGSPIFAGFGIQPVICSARDTNNNTGFCTVNVTIEDYERPKIFCPTNIVGTYSATLPTGYGYPVVTAIDNANLTSLSCMPGSGSVTFRNASFIRFQAYLSGLKLGYNLANCTARDAFGNFEVCYVAVDVRDVTPPKISCPASVTTFTVTGKNMSTPLVLIPTASDNYNVSSVNCTPSVSQASATGFPFGNTNVSCQAFDTAGLTARCFYIVSVLDDEDPIVQCPLNSIAISTFNTSNISVVIPRLNATDNVRVNETRIIVIQNGWPNTTTTLPGSTTTLIIQRQWSAEVTFQAIDSSGNIGACTFSIAVFPPGGPVDTTPPVLYNCPSTMVFNTVPTEVFDSPLYNNSNIFLYNVSTRVNQSFQYITFPNISATDNLGLASRGYLPWSINAVTAATVGMEVGRYVVAYGATDNQGNSAFCVFKVQVLDLQPPRWLNCPSNQTYATSGGTDAIPTSWPATGIRAVDNVGLANQFGTCVSSPAGFCPASGSAPSSLPIGVYSFEYTVSDYAQNPATPCVFYVVVRDADSPVFPDCQSPTTRPVSITTGDVSSFCSQYFNPTDNRAVVATVITSIPPGYTCSSTLPFTNGIPISIIATAFDAANNSARCTLQVSVLDITPPVLSGCSPSSPTTITADCSPNLPTANVSLPTITASDNSGSAFLTVSVLPLSSPQTSGALYPIGVTTLTYTATDPAGTSISCVVRVVVSDTQLPTLIGFPNGTDSISVVLYTNPGTNTSNYTLPNITARDNDAILSRGYVPNTYFPLTTYFFPLGTTTIIYRATDRSGNVATGSIQITVVDHEKPRFLNCPNTTIQANVSAIDSTVVVSWPPPIALDNIDGTSVSMFQTSIPSGFSRGGLFRIGKTQILYTAVDQAGNSETCQFYVQVDDFEPPVLACPDNFTVEVANNLVPFAVVSWRIPTISDNSNNIADISVSSQRGANYSVGDYHVVYSAKDQSNNTGTCSFDFAVTLAPCALGCATCITSSSTSCRSCSQGYYYFNNAQCVIACPSTMYIRNGTTCTPCTPAPTCTNGFFVRSCSGFSDADCIACSTCPVGQIVGLACSSNSDTVCIPSPGGSGTAASESSSSSSSSGTIIAGGAGGGVAILAIIVVVIVLLKKRRPSTTNEPMEMRSPGGERGYSHSGIAHTDLSVGWSGRRTSFSSMAFPPTQAASPYNQFQGEELGDRVSPPPQTIGGRINPLFAFEATAGGEDLYSPTPGVPGTAAPTATKEVNSTRAIKNRLPNVVDFSSFDDDARDVHTEEDDFGFNQTDPNGYMEAVPHRADDGYLDTMPAPEGAGDEGDYREAAPLPSAQQEAGYVDTVPLSRPAAAAHAARHASDGGYMDTVPTTRTNDAGYMLAAPNPHATALEEDGYMEQTPVPAAEGEYFESAPDPVDVGYVESTSLPPARRA
eukprot:m.230203 g.230203  ORF g.230203 m.230203 type:complete len:1808 (-) comp17953_c0_seq1:219-5642(-)